MGAEGINLVLDLRYVRRLCELSRDSAVFSDLPGEDLGRLYTAVKVLNRLIEDAEKNRGSSNGDEG